jgi:hypothetical protein
MCHCYLFEKSFDRESLKSGRREYFLAKVLREQFQEMTTFNLEFSMEFGSPSSLIFLFEVFIYHPDAI